MSGVPVTAGTVTRGEATGGGGVQVARLRRGRRLNPPQPQPSTEGSDRASSKQHDGHGHTKDAQGAVYERFQLLSPHRWGSDRDRLLSQRLEDA